jgi:hypothetical protein
VTFRDGARVSGHRKTVCRKVPGKDFRFS